MEDTDIQMKTSDARMEEILDLLRKGVTREEIADKYGHKDRQAIDQYMRRKNFVWSEADQTYKPSKKHPNYKETDDYLIPERVRRILLEFRSVTADAREIAKRVGFKDHKEMAEFMKTHGFTWSQQHHNYIRTGAREPQQATPSQRVEVELLPHEVSKFDLLLSEQIPNHFVQLFPLLQLLQQNQDRLINLIQQTPPRALTIPRYNLGGGYLTKSLNLHARLVELIKDFSREKSIPQREVMEVALIQFFYCYGYGKRIDAIMLIDR